MSLIFCTIFSLIISIFGMIIYILIEIEKVKKEQDHLLLNLKNISNLIKNFNENKNL